MILSAANPAQTASVQKILDQVNGNKKTSGTTGSTSVAENVQKGLGQEDFLSLLVSELKNQDPMEPMKDKEFIAQVAQFSALDQSKQTNKSLNKLLTTLSQTNVVGMLGKIVTGVSPENGTLTGKATPVRYENGEPIITIENSDGASELKLDQVTKVVLDPFVK